MGIILTLASLALLKLLILRRGLWTGIFFIIILFLGLFLIFVGYCLVPYRIFQDNKPLAIIESQPAELEIYDMALTLKHLTFPENFYPEKFLLIGDQWAIEGGTFKVKLAGNEITFYKIGRIRSRFRRPLNQRQFTELTYALSERPDILMNFLSRHKLFFIEVQPVTEIWHSASGKELLCLYASDGQFKLENKR